MKITTPLPQDKKLTLVLRLEPGCLGPDGEKNIAPFCDFAQKEFASIDAHFAHWEIVPRQDKSLPEVEYKINNRHLARDKATKYLAAFNRSLDEFEEQLHNKIALLINQFLGH